MFGRHPVIAPLGVAIGLTALACLALASGRPGSAAACFIVAVGMAAVAAHSNCERGTW